MIGCKAYSKTSELGKPYPYVDGICSAVYKTDRGFGFIRGFRSASDIFFHISALKRAKIPDCDKIVRDLEEKGAGSLPQIWFVAGENDKGPCVTDFLSNEEFERKWRHGFVSDYADSVKKMILAGASVSFRQQQMLAGLMGESEFLELLKSRYDRNNSAVEKWRLGFVACPDSRQARESGNEMSLRGDIGAAIWALNVGNSSDGSANGCKVSRPMTLNFHAGITERKVIRYGACGFSVRPGEREIFVVPSHLLDHLPEEPVSGKPALVFFKPGTDVSGNRVATDIRRYEDPGEASSDETEIRNFIEERMELSYKTMPEEFVAFCFEALFSGSEKLRVENKMKQARINYLAEQERLAKEAAEARERERIAREKAEAERKAESERMAREAALTEQEFKDLVEEIRPLGYTCSSQVSLYIRSHDLRMRYGRICGNLVMGKNYDTWNYDGGISPAYYARLCTELGLNNKNSGSRVIGFRPYR